MSIMLLGPLPRITFMSPCDSSDALMLFGQATKYPHMIASLSCQNMVGKNFLTLLKMC